MECEWFRVDRVQKYFWEHFLYFLNHCQVARLWWWLTYTHPSFRNTWSLFPPGSLACISIYLFPWQPYQSWLLLLADLRVCASQSVCGCVCAVIISQRKIEGTPIFLYFYILYIYIIYLVFTVCSLISDNHAFLICAVTDYSRAALLL